MDEANARKAAWAEAVSELDKETIAVDEMLRTDLVSDTQHLNSFCWELLRHAGPTTMAAAGADLDIPTSVPGVFHRVKEGTLLHADTQTAQRDPAVHGLRPDRDESVASRATFGLEHPCYELVLRQCSNDGALGDAGANLGLLGVLEVGRGEAEMPHLLQRGLVLRDNLHQFLLR